MAFTRRAFLARGAALAGAMVAALVPIGVMAAPRSRAYYRLNSDVASEAGCKACRLHAQNKLFASAQAADLQRAHPYCKCEVVLGEALPFGTWTALFGAPNSLARAAVDRRWADVTAALTR